MLSKMLDTAVTVVLLRIFVQFSQSIQCSHVCSFLHLSPELDISTCGRLLLIHINPAKLHWQMFLNNLDWSYTLSVIYLWFSESKTGIALCLARCMCLHCFVVHVSPLFHYLPETAFIKPFTISEFWDEVSEAV